MIDICENCKYFDENKQYVNGCYLCKFHQLTVNPSNYGCYKIQFNKVDKYNKNM